MQRHARRRRPDSPGQPHVLDDQRVHSQHTGLLRHLQGGVQLILPHQGVESQMHRHPPGMTIRHRLP